MKNISNFITGTDNYINLDISNQHDKSTWYFKAPEKYNIDLSLAYFGWIEFVQTFFSGDLAKLNNLDLTPLVKIRCDKLGYTINHFYKINKLNWFGNKFTIKLDEKNWKKSPNRFNGFDRYDELSKNDFVNCLENINSFEILGDWLRDIESVGLDLVSIYKLT